VNAPPIAELVQGGGLLLQRNRFVRLHNAQGWRIDCVSGSAWITQDGDRQDTLLAAGQSHVARRAARLLVQALDDCALHIAPAPGRPLPLQAAGV